MTMVPPSKSTPFCRPRVMMTPNPATITISDRTMACHRHRTKSKLLWLRNFMMPLDAERGLRGRLTQQHGFENGPRYEDGGKQIGQQADEQGRGETPDRTGAEHEQEGRRDQRRHVSVEQGEEDAVEALGHRGSRAGLGRQLLLDALEDQHVR